MSYTGKMVTYFNQIIIFRLYIVAIACGELCVMFLGNNEFQHYVTTGNAVNDVNRTEKFCEPGWIVLSPYAWSLCDAEKMEYQMMDDDQHVRVCTTCYKSILLYKCHAVAEL